MNSNQMNIPPNMMPMGGNPSAGTSSNAAAAAAAVAGGGGGGAPPNVMVANMNPMLPSGQMSQVGPSTVVTSANTNLPANVAFAGQNISSMQAAPQATTSNVSTQPMPNDIIIVRLRTLVSSLREYLRKLVEISANNIYHNSQIDNAPRTSEDGSTIERFDKALEEFYSTCNVIELYIRTILECAIQTRDSENYLPYKVAKDFAEISPGGQPYDITYPNCLNVIRKQVTYAKSVYEILADSVKQIKHLEPMQTQSTSSAIQQTPMKNQ